MKNILAYIKMVKKLVVKPNLLSTQYSDKKFIKKF